MSALVVAASGWVAAAAAFAVVWVLRAEGERRMSLVAQAAHELRAPIGAALLGLHGVVEGAAGARRVAAVELELRRAGLALADLDAAPRGRWAPGRTEALDVRALLADAVEAWRPLAGALGGELHFAPGGPRLLVRADRLRLTQAVGNVVLNALEHGAGPVRVRAHATRTHVRIEVRDHGPGLPAPVAALATAPPHAGRRGHGLAIAARAVACHDGRLLTAPVSAGACVVLELPPRRRAPREPPPARRPAARARARPRRARGLRRRPARGGGARAARPVVQVVVARTDLPPGRPLDGADLGLRRVPARYAPVGAAAVPETLIGQRLATAVPRGAYLGAGQIAVAPERDGPPVRKGERAAEVVGLGTPGLIVPGARVDVLVTREGDAGAAAAGTELALEDVEVLAARPAPAGAGAEGSERVAATLRVSVRDAVYLAAAQSFAREVRLLPRAAGDRGRAGPVAVGPELR